MLASDTHGFYSDCTHMRSRSALVCAASALAAVSCSTAAASSLEPAFLADCAHLPGPSASSLELGGHFATGSDSQCSIQGLVSKSSGTVCLAQDGAGIDSVVLHSIAWSKEKSLGHWAWDGTMLKYGDGSQCLTVASLDVGTKATLSSCQAGGHHADGGGHQDW